MTYLNNVTNAPVQEGQRIVIAGGEGIGKTTLACDAPNSLLVPMEMGYASIRTPRLPTLITEWRQVIEICEELLAAAKAGTLKRGSSIVWDSATALERLIHNEVIATDPDMVKAIRDKTQPPKNLTMETCHGGYGKGYQLANDLFARWTRAQDELARYGGVNCIVTCHVFTTVVKDAAYGEYNSWDLLLHSPKNDKTYGKREFMTQWADMIGFLHEPLFVMKAEKGQTLARGIDANQGRQLAVDRTPGWVAKNRYGLTGLIPIPDPKTYPHGWNYIAQAIYTNTGIDLYNREP